MSRVHNGVLMVIDSAIEEPTFRCYFIDFNGRVCAVERFDAASDHHAIQTALVLFHGDLTLASLELWSREKLIFCYKRLSN